MMQLRAECLNQVLQRACEMTAPTSTIDGGGAMLVFARVMGRWWSSDLRYLPLPSEDERKAKRDRLVLVGDGEVIDAVPCSTWPFRDRTGGVTKVALPVFAPAGMCVGVHGRTRRTALVDQGFHLFRGAEYELDGTPTGDESRIVGMHVHDDRGSSEACFTVASEASLQEVARQLAKLPPARLHPKTGAACYDTCIVHVQTLGGY